MNTNNTRFSVLLCCALALLLPLSVGCDAELKVGDFDGSLFEDAGSDSSTGNDSGNDSSVNTDAGRDATTADAGTDAGEDASVGPDTNAIIRILAEATCTALYNCTSEQFVSNTLSGEDCDTENTHRLQNGALSRLADSIADGRVIFDMSRLNACVAAIEAQGCNVEGVRRPAVCEEAIDGTVALGGSCVISEDCSGTTSYCKRDGACPSRCVAFLNNGAACSADSECARGLVCATVDGLRQCVTPGGPGAYCVYTDTPPCRTGLVCTPNTGDDDTCKSASIVYVRQNGQTCDPAAGSFCEQGLVCTNTMTGFFCAPVAARDGACFRAQPTQCPADQYCSATTGMAGTCLDLPTEGETCLPSSRSQRCAQGFVCLLHGAGDGDDECTEKVDNNTSCSVADECYSGNCSNNVCAPPASLCTL